MKKFLVFGVILIITLVVGVSLKNKKPDYAPLSQETTQSQQDIPRSDTSKSDTSKLDNLPLMDSNQYLDYSPQNLSLSQKKGRTILFFKADWCSTCNALNKELLSESAVLPEDVTILKINYSR